MERISKKSKILVLALIAFTVMICGAVSLSPTVLYSQENDTKVTTSWYEFEHKNNEIIVRLTDDIRTLRSIKNEDVDQLKSTLTSALKSIFMDTILNNTNKTQGVALTAYEIPEDFNSKDFWNEVQGDPKKFKEYIVQRLSDPDELESFADNEYDMLLEQVIGEYIQSKQQEEGFDESKLKEEYGKIEKAIEDVVAEAAEKAAGTYAENEAKKELKRECIQGNPSATQEDIDDYVNKNLESYKNNHEKELAQKAEQFKNEQTEAVKKNEVVSQAVQKVEQNGGKAPSITVDDMLAAIRGIDIDNHHLYDKTNSLSDEGLKYVIKLLPRPAKFAEMNSEELKNLINTNLQLDTTYGKVEIKVTFGFFGTTKTIQRAAKLIADHLDVIVDGKNLTVNVNVPELVSKFLLSLYNAGGISTESKDAIFGLFEHSFNDFVNGDAYNSESLINLLKEVNYQKLFENFLSASALNEYFGSYLEEVMGRKITDADIQRVVGDLKRYATKVSTWDHKNVADFLYNIPGFKGLADSVSEGKLQSVVDRFIEIVKKIDWEKYDVDQIIEILQKDTITQKVYGYIDSFDNFGTLYDQMLSYIGKIGKFLPEGFGEEKISEFYKGETKLNFSGVWNIELAEIMQTVSNSFGDRFSSIIDKLTTAVQNKNYEYDLTFNMNLPKLHKVQYVYDIDGDGDFDVLKEGLLPENAKIESVAPETIEINGEAKEVKYWVEADAKIDLTAPEDSIVENMPSKDVQLRAILEIPEKIIVKLTNPYLSPTVAGYKPSTTDRKVRFTYENTEKGVRWNYGLVGVSNDGSQHYSEAELRQWLEIETSGSLKATNVGEYKNTLTIRPADTEYKDLIVFEKDKKEYTYEESWFIEKIVVKVSDIKLTTDDEGAHYDDENYALYFESSENNEHTVKWDYTITVENNYDKFWTDEKIAELLTITTSGLEGSTVNTDFEATLKIAVNEANKDNVVLEAVDETAKWVIKEEVPKTEIDLSNAQWYYENNVFDPQADIFADGSEKSLTVGNVNDTVKGYFDSGVLEVVYYKDGTKLSGAPSEAGTYTVKVELTDNEKYNLVNNIAEATLTIKEQVVPPVKTQIDLTGAKWTYNGTDLENNTLEVDYDGEAKELEVTGNGIDQYFTDDVLEIVYYSGENKISGAPSEVGTYTAKVELKNTEEYELTNNIENATLTIKDTQSKDVEIDLSGAKWMFEGNEITGNVVEVEHDGEAKELTVEGTDEIEEYFTDGILEVVYYKDGTTKLSEAPSEVGTYTVKVELKATSGYVLKTNIADATLTIKEQVVPPVKTQIDLTGAKWTYNGTDLESNTLDVDYDGEAKELEVTGNGIDQYFTDDVLEIVYYSGENKISGAPTVAGTYTAKVELKNNEEYELTNNIADATIIINAAGEEDIQIDLSGAKWTFEGKELTNNTIEVENDGKAKELKIKATAEIEKYFTDGILEVVYYNGTTKLSGAPKDSGTYTVKVELKATSGYELKNNIADATLTIKDTQSKDVEIDLSDAKWTFEGNELTNNAIEVESDGEAKALEIKATAEIEKYFTDKVLEIVYYSGTTKLSGAPSEVGTYTVKVELKATSGYVLKTNIADATLTIKESAQPPVTKTDIDLSGAKWMYDGKDYNSEALEADGYTKALTVGGVSDEIAKYFENGVLKVVYYDKDGKKLSAAPSEAGVYTVKVELTDTTKYELKNNIKDAKLTIEEKDHDNNWWLIVLTVGIAAVVIVGIVLVDLLVIKKKKNK